MTSYRSPIFSFTAKTILQGTGLDTGKRGRQKERRDDDIKGQLSTKLFFTVCRRRHEPLPITVGDTEDTSFHKPLSFASTFSRLPWLGKCSPVLRGQGSRRNDYIFTCTRQKECILNERQVTGIWKIAFNFFLFVYFSFSRFLSLYLSF